jgi:hypothetical protein
MRRIDEFQESGPINLLEHYGFPGDHQRNAPSKQSCGVSAEAKSRQQVLCPIAELRPLASRLIEN